MFTASIAFLTTIVTCPRITMLNNVKYFIMKITKLILVVILSVYVLSACSSNEDILTEIEQKMALKSYEVKRDATGAYFLDYELESYVRAQAIDNPESNTNELHLYQSDFVNSNQQTEALFIDGNQLNIGFIDTRTGNKSSISIEDEYGSLNQKKAKDTKMLSEYSIITDEKGVFNLEFKVNDQVVVEFIYVDETGIHEIHLQEGKSAENVFSRNLTKPAGVPLKIDFVQHINNNTSAKGSVADAPIKRRKPRIVVSSGGM
jgi:hypothetical protein